MIKNTNINTRASRQVKDFYFEDSAGNEIIIQATRDYNDQGELADFSDEQVILGNKHYDALSDEDHDEIMDIISDNF